MTTYTDRIAGLNGNVGMKPPVRVATTADITLEGLQTIDSVALAAGDRVLVKDQSAGAENGIWVAAAGAWTRALDFNGARDVVSGTQMFAAAGTTNGGKNFYISNADPITIGATELTFVAAVQVGTQPYDADLAAIAALTSAADKVPYATGAATWALTDFTVTGRAVVAASDEAAARAAIDAQEQAADLDAIAALSSAADKVPYATGSETWALADFTAAGRTLVAGANAAAQRASLGIGVIPFAGIIFNGTGTVAVISSFGMHASTPLTDNGTGQYTVTLDAAEPDTNYYPVFSGGQLAGTGDTFFGITAKSTTALTFTVFQAASSATPTDRNLIHVLFFR